jgi:malonyl-CoA O-methyltransferase
MDKDKIGRNFSRYARYYDRYCNMQNLSASGLIDRISPRKFKRILDIGCGTGNYTKRLREFYPDARITAIDISQDMVDIAREKLNGADIRFIVGDAEKLEINGEFDFITSNACFQWFDNLALALLEYKRLLRRDGVLLFSVFGPLTFYELGESIKGLSKNATGIISERFIEYKTIKDIMERLFKKNEFKEKLFKESHSSLEELLKKIRYTGTAANGTTRQGLWTASSIEAIDKIYREKFKAITATYQVFFCKGVK